MARFCTPKNVTTLSDTAPIVNVRHCSTSVTIIVTYPMSPQPRRIDASLYRNAAYDDTADAAKSTIFSAFTPDHPSRGTRDSGVHGLTPAAFERHGEADRFGRHGHRVVEERRLVGDAVVRAAEHLEHQQADQVAPQHDPAFEQIAVRCL